MKNRTTAMNIFMFSLIFQQIIIVLCQETTIAPPVTDNVDGETTTLESVSTIRAVSFIENSNNTTIEDEILINTDDRKLSTGESTSSERTSEIDSSKSTEGPSLSKIGTETMESGKLDEKTENVGISKTDEMSKIEEESKPNETEKTMEDEKTVESEKLNETPEVEDKVTKNSEEIPPPAVENAEIPKEDAMQNDQASTGPANAVNEPSSSLSTSGMQDTKSSTENIVSSSTSTTGMPIVDESTTKLPSELTSILISTVSKTTHSSVIYKVSSGTPPSRSTTVSPLKINGNHTKNSANAFSSSVVSVLLLLGNVYCMRLYF